jgi:hypothetical protein
MSTIINLYGGPGTGKSTSAAYLFYALKNQKADVELVREYVKDWAWEGRKISTYDQLYFLGKQIRKESMLYGKVDWIVTDAPILLSIYYAMHYCPLSVSEGVRAATLAYYRQAAEDGHKHVHILLSRTKPYNPKGRFQTEDQARLIDTELRLMLDHLKFPYREYGTGEESLKLLLQDLKGE